MELRSEAVADVVAQVAPPMETLVHRLAVAVDTPVAVQQRTIPTAMVPQLVNQGLAAAAPENRESPKPIDFRWRKKKSREKRWPSASPGKPLQSKASSLFIQLISFSGKNVRVYYDVGYKLYGVIRCFSFPFPLFPTSLLFPVTLLFGVEKDGACAWLWLLLSGMGRHGYGDSVLQLHAFLLAYLLTPNTRPDLGGHGSFSYVFFITSIISTHCFDHV